MRRRSRTFPFWSIGAGVAATDFFEALAIGAHRTFPLRAIYGKCSPEHYARQPFRPDPLKPIIEALRGRRTCPSRQISGQN